MLVLAQPLCDGSSAGGEADCMSAQVPLVRGMHEPIASSRLEALVQALPAGADSVGDVPVCKAPMRLS